MNLGSKVRLLISGGEGGQEDGMRGRESTWFDVDPCAGSSFIFLDDTFVNA